MDIFMHILLWSFALIGFFYSIAALQEMKSYNFFTLGFWCFLPASYYDNKGSYYRIIAVFFNVISLALMIYYDYI